jgi:hypothetical protein
MKNQVIKGLLNGAIVVALLAAFTQLASARIDTPDAASTSCLMGAVCCGLMCLRRWIR